MKYYEVEKYLNRAIKDRHGQRRGEKGDVRPSHMVNYFSDHEIGTGDLVLEKRYGGDAIFTFHPKKGLTTDNYWQKMLDKGLISWGNRSRETMDFSEELLEHIAGGRPKYAKYADYLARALFEYLANFPKKGTIRIKEIVKDIRKLVQKNEKNVKENPVSKKLSNIMNKAQKYIRKGYDKSAALKKAWAK